MCEGRDAQLELKPLAVANRLRQRELATAADVMRREPQTQPQPSDWTHFADLTFTNDVPEGRAMEALRWWLRALAKHSHTHVPYVFALGYQGNRRLHFHVLLAVAAHVPISVRWLDRHWRLSDRVANFARVNVYDSTRDGVPYLANHNGHWDVNIACPRTPRCRRRNGCQEAPSSWR